MIESSLHSTARRQSGKMDKFVLSETQKKKLCLHLEGYKYYKRRQNANGTIAWRCCRYTSSGCVASILTEEDNVKSRSHDHNHAPDEATLVKDQLRVALKKAAAANPNTPVPRLFQEELLRTCSAVPDEVAAEVPTFATLKDTMYRERRSAQPPLPSSASTLQLNDAHKKTESAEPFLVVDDRSDPSWWLGAQRSDAGLAERCPRLSPVPWSEAGACSVRHRDLVPWLGASPKSRFPARGNRAVSKVRKLRHSHRPRALKRQGQAQPEAPQKGTPTTPLPERGSRMSKMADEAQKGAAAPAPPQDSPVAHHTRQSRRSPPGKSIISPSSPGMRILRQLAAASQKSLLGPPRTPRTKDKQFPPPCPSTPGLIPIGPIFASEPTWHLAPPSPEHPPTTTARPGQQGEHTPPTPSPAPPSTPEDKRPEPPGHASPPAPQRDSEARAESPTPPSPVSEIQRGAASAPTARLQGHPPPKRKAAGKKNTDRDNNNNNNSSNNNNNDDSNNNNGPRPPSPTRKKPGGAPPAFRPEASGAPERQEPITPNVPSERPPLSKEALQNISVTTIPTKHRFAGMTDDCEGGDGDQLDGTVTATPATIDPAERRRGKNSKQQRPKATQKPPARPTIRPGERITVLVRPTGTKGQFNVTNKLKIARALTLATNGRALATRVNTRRNVAAVDLDSPEAIDIMLGVKVLHNIAVTTYLSKPTAQSRGIVRPRFEAETAEVVEGISSAVPIQRTDVFAGGRTIRLHFHGPRPHHVDLWGLRLPVTAAHPRPIQCGACGRLGHTRRACREKNRCPYCCGAHPKNICRRDTTRCPNCDGDHDAFDRSCVAYERARQWARAAEAGRQAGGLHGARGPRRWTGNTAEGDTRRGQPNAMLELDGDFPRLDAPGGGGTSADARPLHRPAWRQAQQQQAPSRADQARREETHQEQAPRLPVVGLPRQRTPSHDGAASCAVTTTAAPDGREFPRALRGNKPGAFPQGQSALRGDHGVFSQGHGAQRGGKLPALPSALPPQEDHLPAGPQGGDSELRVLLEQLTRIIAALAQHLPQRSLNGLHRACSAILADVAPNSHLHTNNGGQH
ncbi:hypothetical protein ISCGN_002961 [Ixodes scapularis]